MNHEETTRLVDRVLHHVQHRTTDVGDRVGAVATTAYTAPARLEAERALFDRTPLMVGHASEVAQEGEFFTRDVAGTPVLVVRSHDGVVRGFRNVCRHRGARVVPEPAGRARSFSCPYHRWTYRTDGRLAGIPHAHGFPQVEVGAHGLSAIEVELHAGFVWARLGAGSGVTAPDHLGALGRDFVDDQLPDHVVLDRRVLQRAMNWKLAIDVFLEAYHLKTTHERSIYPLFFDTLGLVDAFEPHLRNVFPKRTIETLRGTDRSRWRLRDHANVLYYVFPNTLILMEPDHASVLHISPVTVDRCRLDTYTLVPEAPTSDKTRRYWAANNEILYTAIEEDLTIGETIQDGLESGANDRLNFGTFEHSLTYFHAWLAARLQGPGKSG